MTIITRFAPSPTGYLHIGGARTALFNYLYAKKHHGKFLLRIEDTDKQRSTTEATEAIFKGLEWLGINYDDEVIFQSERINEHKNAALKLLAEGKAYYCFCLQEEIEEARAKAIAKKEHFIFLSPWRDVNPATYPQDQKPVIRLKAPRSGTTIIHDQLQGDVEVANDHLDDMILLRSDGTPTYMLAVVVDDHDMGITHIIRGDDHLNNAARQIILYEALGYNVPVMVHIPLIHGEDGAKLSKRHGALGIDSYKEAGFLPEAICNYLLKLGWGHGNDEIISREQAIEWFDIDGFVKSPARLDIAKMKYINAHYLRNMDNNELVNITIQLLEKAKISNIYKDNIIKAIDSIKIRVQVLTELAPLAKIYLPGFKIVSDDITSNPELYSRHPELDSGSKKNINEILKQVQDDEESVQDTSIVHDDNGDIIASTIELLEKLTDFSKDNIQVELKSLARQNNIKISELMQPIRILLTGMLNSPSVFEIIAIIGKKETIRRLSNTAWKS